MFERINKGILRYVAWTAAVLVFIGGSYFAVTDLIKHNIELKFNAHLLIALCSVFVTVILSAYRFCTVANIMNANFSLTQSIRVVILGSVANILPLPGAFLVRHMALREKIGDKQSFYVNSLSVAIWLNISLLFALISLLRLELPKQAFIVTLIVIVLCIGNFIWASIVAMNRIAVVKYVLIQSLLTSVFILRMWFVALGIGIDVSLAVPGVISVGGVLASLSGFVPGGIGVEELLGAAISTGIGELATLGFIIVAVNRLVMWCGLALSSMLLFVSPKQAHPPLE